MGGTVPASRLKPPAVASPPVVCTDAEHSALAATLVAERKQFAEKVKLLESHNAERESNMEAMKKELQVATQEITKLKAQSPAQGVSSELQQKVTQLEDELEAATVDKEVAEQRVEELEEELQQVKGTDGAPPALQTENQQLLQALVQLRDLAAADKDEREKLIADLQRHNAELAKRVEDKTSEAAELCAALEETTEAQALAEKLTEDNLTKAEQIKDLAQQLKEMEEYKTISEELERDQDQSERRLQAIIYDKEMEVVAAASAIHDLQAQIDSHKKTIAKYKDFVKTQNERIQELEQGRESDKKMQQQLQGTEQELQSLSRALQTKQLKETEQDLQLLMLQLNAEQNRETATFFQDIIPERLLMPGDMGLAMQHLLLRMAAKSSLGMDHLHSALLSATVVPSQASAKTLPEGMNDTEDEALTMDQQMVYWKAIDVLNSIHYISCKFCYAFERCDVDTYLAIGRLYHDIEPHERTLDSFLTLLHQDQLTSAKPFDSLMEAHQAIRKALEQTTKAANFVTSLPKMELAFMAEHTQCLSRLCLQYFHQYEEFQGDRTSKFPIGELTAAAELCRQMVGISGHIDFGCHPAEWTEAVSQHIATAAALCESFLDTIAKGDLTRNFKTDAASLFQIVSNLQITLSEPGLLLPPDKQTPQPDVKPPWKVRADQIKSQLKEAATLREELEKKQADVAELKKAKMTAEYSLQDERRKQETLQSHLHVLQNNETEMYAALDVKDATLKRKEEEYTAALQKLQEELRQARANAASDLSVPNGIGAAATVGATAAANLASRQTTGRNLTHEEAKMRNTIKLLTEELGATKSSLKYALSENTQLTAKVSSHDALQLKPLPPCWKQTGLIAHALSIEELQKKLRLGQAETKLVDLRAAPQHATPPQSRPQPLAAVLAEVAQRRADVRALIISRSLDALGASASAAEGLQVPYVPLNHKFFEAKLRIPSSSRAHCHYTLKVTPQQLEEIHHHIF
eukprot:TRINITY_DN8828_c0_g1_i1.p1 TRINITY_DN8828_c0_g1~~TRINITY_DN8828_c0_g1_i1.p1  ORF type:complete len:1126 (-),score=364.25 TRINITY_DN8828_c0_g1_i1:59-2995(-)